jgi:cysteine desulfurase/selenocysteine lyase
MISFFSKKYGTSLLVDIGNGSVHRGVYPLAEKADQLYTEARKVAADFIGADSEEIIFTKNATEAVNLAAFGIGEALIKAGDNVGENH